MLLLRLEPPLRSNQQGDVSRRWSTCCTFREGLAQRGAGVGLEQPAERISARIECRGEGERFADQRQAIATALLAGRGRDREPVLAPAIGCSSPALIRFTPERLPVMGSSGLMALRVRLSHGR